jgi:hypothetical protein
MKKARASLVLCLLAGVALVVVSIWMIVRDTNINLAKSDIIIGKVNWCGVADTRPGHHDNRRVFSFLLDNSTQKFAIHHAEERYTDLLFNVKPGDSVKAYYRPVRHGMNLHVFQLEKNGKVLEPYDNYEKEISAGAELMLIVGIILIAIVFISYRKVNVFKWLDSLVRS